MSWPLITFSVIPFQRDSPADPEDPVEMLIWRALKVGNSCCCCCCGRAVLPENAPVFCLFVSSCFFAFCVLRVFSAASLPYQKIKLAFPKQIGNFWGLWAPVRLWLSSLQPHQISKKDAGVYEVVLKDERGKDTSTLNLTDQGWRSEIKNTHATVIRLSWLGCDLLFQVSKIWWMKCLDSLVGKSYVRIPHSICSLADDFKWLSTAANSSTPLKITSTSEGIRLYTFVSYYNDLLPVTWHYKWVLQPVLTSSRHSHSTTTARVWCVCWPLRRLAARESAIAFSDRIKSGVVGDQLWLQITEPTEKDTGKYAIEFSDGKGGVRRTVELSGQGERHGLTLYVWLTVRLISKNNYV